MFYEPSYKSRPILRSEHVIIRSTYGHLLRRLHEGGRLQQLLHLVLRLLRGLAPPLGTLKEVGVDHACGAWMQVTGSPQNLMADETLGRRHTQQCRHLIVQQSRRSVTTSMHAQWLLTPMLSFAISGQASNTAAACDCRHFMFGVCSCCGVWSTRVWQPYHGTCSRQGECLTSRMTTDADSTVAPRVSQPRELLSSEVV